MCEDLHDYETGHFRQKEKQSIYTLQIVPVLVAMMINDQ